MTTSKCDWCGCLFWSDRDDEGMCPECREAPVRKQNTERAVEQWLKYVQKLRGSKHDYAVNADGSK